MIKWLNDYNETIITITITKFSLVLLVIDYNEIIIISKNGDYNDYNKQKWQFLIASFVNSENGD